MRQLLFILIAVIAVSCGSGDSGDTGKPGSMARFAIIDKQLYTVSNSDLSVFDLSNPAKPELKTTQYIPGFVETIFPKDSLLFFGTRNGMLIYDNSNPFEPQFISEYAHIFSCDPVVVSKNYAFVTLNSGSINCGRGLNQLEIIDLQDIKNPTQIAQYDMVSPRGLGIDREVLFVCDDGLKAYHADDFQNLELIEKFDVDAYDVIPDDGYLMLIGKDGFHQYKYTDRTMLRVSSIYID